MSHADECTKLLVPEKPRCLGVGRLQVAAGWSHVAHVHDFHQLLLVLGGRLLVGLVGGELAAGPGHFLAYPRGTEHAERAAPPDGSDFVYCAFTGELRGAPRRALDTDGRAPALAAWLAAEATGDAGDRQTTLDELLRLLLREFARAAAGDPPVFVARVRAHAAAHLAERLTVADLAAVAAMSPAHFTRRYRAAVGATPMADIRRLRMETARNLVATTDLPLKAVAERVGACDAHHLSRLFKRRFGHPPGFYRR